MVGVLNRRRLQSSGRFSFNFHTDDYYSTKETACVFGASCQVGDHALVAIASLIGNPTKISGSEYRMEVTKSSIDHKIGYRLGTNFPKTEFSDAVQETENRLAALYDVVSFFNDSEDKTS